MTTTKKTYEVIFSYVETQVMQAQIVADTPDEAKEKLSEAVADTVADFQILQVRETNIPPLSDIEEPIPVH